MSSRSHDCYFPAKRVSRRYALQLIGHSEDLEAVFVHCVDTYKERRVHVYNIDRQFKHSAWCRCLNNASTKRSRNLIVEMEFVILECALRGTHQPQHASNQERRT
jgi:hypothetical protein